MLVMFHPSKVRYGTVTPTAIDSYVSYVLMLVMYLEQLPA